MHSHARLLCSRSNQFFSPVLPPLIARLRPHCDAPADPITVINSSFSGLRLLSGGISFSPPSTFGEFLRAFNHDIHHSNYVSLLNHVESFIKQFPENPYIFILGYLSTLLLLYKEKERHYAAAVANTLYPPADLPHFAHLLDELSVVGLNARMPLMRLLIGGALINWKAGEGGMVVPVVTLKSGRRGLETIQKIASLKIERDKRFPRLEPVPESFECVEFDSAADLPKMVEMGVRLPEAISFASAVLEAQPADRDALFYRAMALARSGKYTDAILDLRKLEDVGGVEELKDVEKQLWFMLGQRPNERRGV